MKKEDAQKLVGKAFRGKDGIIRWITHLSQRNYLHLLWLHDEGSNTWHDGGKIKTKDFASISGEEYPITFSNYKLIGATGMTLTKEIKSKLKPLISIKQARKINQVFVADTLLDNSYSSTYNGRKQCFTDNPPEEWHDQEKQIFDLVHETEMKLKQEIFDILGIDTDKL